MTAIPPLCKAICAEFNRLMAIYQYFPLCTCFFRTSSEKQIKLFKRLDGRMERNGHGETNYTAANPAYDLETEHVFECIMTKLLLRRGIVPEYILSLLT